MSSRFLFFSLLILLILALSLPYIRSYDENDFDDEAEIDDLLDLDNAAEYEVDDADYDIDEANNNLDTAYSDDISSIGYDHDGRHRRSRGPIVSAPAPNVSPALLAQLRSHNTRSSCWSVLNGVVYDLTNFRHTGGQSKILAVCGKDMTASLHAKHKLQFDNFFANRRVG